MKFCLSLYKTAIGKGISAFTTPYGYFEVLGHVARRVSVYLKAYNEWLKIFEKEILSRCKKDGLSPDEAKSYKKKLSDWLTAKQDESAKQFTQWSRYQQEGITEENTRQETFDDQPFNPMGPALFDHIKYYYTIPDPQPFTVPLRINPVVDMNCPQ